MKDPDTRIFINFSFIGLTVQDEYVIIYETDDQYFIQFWDDIHAKMSVELIPEETALMFMQNARDAKDRSTGN